MPKYPPLQLEEIKNIIIDCQIRRLTNTETHARLRELRIDISFATVKNYKSQIKSQSQTWLANLAKSKRQDYIAQYRERILEIETVQKKLWSIIEAQQTGPRTQVEACGKLLDCTETLTQLYDVLPVVNAIRDYDTAEEYRRQVQTDKQASNSYGVSGNGNQRDRDNDFRTPV